MRTASAAQRLKPEDEEGRRALIALPLDVNAPRLRPLFPWFPSFVLAAL